MKRQLLKVITFSIFIGVIALAINTAFGNQTITYLEKIKVTQTNGWNFYYYKFNFWTYIQNLSLTTSDLSQLQFEIPTRQWDSNFNWDNWIYALGNNMQVILNYIIMIINILLYPLRVGAYLVRNILAVFGVNNDTTEPNNGLAWLIIFVRDILGQIAIPYL